MAEVNYQREPTVSVHGLPKSQYEAGALPQSGGAGGGIGASFKQHWVWWAAAGGVLIIAYIIYVKYGSGSNTTSNAAIDPNTGLPVGATSPDQLWGSQLDSDYQQMISLQNQLLGYFNGTNNTTTPPTGTPPPTNNPPTAPGPDMCFLECPGGGSAHKDPTTGQCVCGTPVGKPIPGPNPIPAPQPQYHTDTVHGGDTLSGIASRTGFANWQALFNFGTNATTIKNTAIKHGQWNPSDPGHWIYPGEVLQVH